MEKFTNIEKSLFSYMIDTYIKAEEEEIISCDQHNISLINDAKERLKAFRSIKSKIEKVFY